MSNYSKGLSWGKRIFAKNLDDWGEVGVYKSDKATKTCNEYVSGKRSKTKTGKTVSADMKEFYRGVVDGMNKAYRDWNKN